MAQISEAKIPETQRTEEGRLFEKEFDTVLGGEKKAATAQSRSPRLAP